MTLKPTLLKTNPNTLFLNYNTNTIQPQTTNIARTVPLEQTQKPTTIQNSRKKFIKDFLRAFVGISAIMMSIYLISSSKNQNNKAISAEFEKLSAEIQSLKASYDPSAINRLAQQMSELEGRISNNSEINKMSKEIERISQELGNLKKANKGDSTSIISKSLENLTRQINSLQEAQKKQPDFSESIEAIKKDIKALKKGQKSKATEAIQASIEALEKKASELQVAVEKAQTSGVESINKTTNEGIDYIRKASRAEVEHLGQKRDSIITDIMATTDDSIEMLEDREEEIADLMLGNAKKMSNALKEQTKEHIEDIAMAAKKATIPTPTALVKTTSPITPKTETVTSSIIKEAQTEPKKAETIEDIIKETAEKIAEEAKSKTETIVPTKTTTPVVPKIETTTSSIIKEAQVEPKKAETIEKTVENAKDSIKKALQNETDALKEIASPKIISAPKKKLTSILESNIEGVETATKDRKGFYRTPNGKLASGYYTKAFDDKSTVGINLENGMIIKSARSKKVGIRNKYNFLKTYVRQHGIIDGKLEDRTTILKTDSPKATTGTRTVIRHRVDGTGKKAEDIVSVFNVDFESKTEHEIKRTVCTPKEILQYDASNGIENCKVSRIKRDTKERAAFEVLPNLKYSCYGANTETRSDGSLVNTMTTFILDDEYRNPIYTEGCLNAISKAV